MRKEDKNMNRSFVHSVCLIAALATAAGPDAHAAALGTAFTYQGRLDESGVAANGTYDFEFALYDLSEGGVQEGGTLTAEDLAVSNGLFEVQLDFTGAPFSGAARFLEIRVRPGASNGGYSALVPRQLITSNGTSGPLRPYKARYVSSKASSISRRCRPLNSPPGNATETS